MSAYIVTESVVSYLATACVRVNGEGLLYHHGGRWCRVVATDPIGATERTPVDVANILWFENAESVRYRYNGESIETPRLERIRLRWSYTKAVEVLKAADCLEYQSCEHNSWSASEAHAILQALRTAMIAQLPGYEDAEWGAPPDDAEAFRRATDAAAKVAAEDRARIDGCRAVLLRRHYAHNTATGARARCYYSRSEIRGRDCVTLYGKTCLDDLRAVFGAAAENASDTASDYIVSDTVRIFAGEPLFNSACEMAEARARR